MENGEWRMENGEWRVENSKGIRDEHSRLEKAASLGEGKGFCAFTTRITCAFAIMRAALWKKP